MRPLPVEEARHGRIAQGGKGWRLARFGENARHVAQATKPRAIGIRQGEEPGPSSIPCLNELLLPRSKKSLRIYGH